MRANNDSVCDKRSTNIIKAFADDVEVLLRCVLKFVQAMGDAGLMLITEPKRFRHFRLCLDDRLQDEWDAIASDATCAATKMTAFFNVCRNELINRCIRETDPADQKGCLDALKKPFKMTVKQLFF